MLNSGRYAGPAGTRDRRSQAQLFAMRNGTVGPVPVIALIAAVGLVAVAIADVLGRAGFELDLVFWLGISLMVLPAAKSLIDPATSRRDRVAIVAVLGLALYVVKVLHSPGAFTLYDEMQHVRTAEDIVLTGRLYSENPLLFVSPLYPGLEVVTAIVSRATGAGVFEAGLVVVGAARLLLVVGLFLFVERVVDDHRIAGIATLVYMANPNFLFFDAQFGYESLALGLVAIVLYLTLLSAGHWMRGAVAAVVVAAAVVMTHHFTTYAMVAVLVVWTVAWYLSREDRMRGPGPLWVTLLSVVAAIGWLFLVAARTFDYLGPRFADALALVGLITGADAGRILFQGAGGASAPPAERLVGFASVILLLVALPLGLSLLWRSYRRVSAAVALGILALAYPVTLALRVTARGAEEASRTSGYVFLGVGLVVALAVAFVLARMTTRPAAFRSGFLAVCLVVFVGGVVVGMPRWSRFPGPYLPGADSRSIEAQSIRTAEWAREKLGADRRIVTDRVNRLVMGVYGRQRPVTNYADQVRTYEVFFADTLGDAERSVLERGDIEYLVVDHRLAGVAPLASSYFETGEPREFAATGGLTLAQLTKFDDIDGMDRIFDAGDIVIYDVSAITTGVRE